MMKQIRGGRRIDDTAFGAGIFNLIHVGALFPLNAAATAYFMLRARIRLYTALDALVALFLAAGVVSLVINVLPLLGTAGIDGVNLLHVLKSFFVSMTALAYFSGYRFDVQRLMRTMLWVVAGIGLAILIHWSYLLLFTPRTLPEIRSAQTWAAGWPTRWAAFALVAYFHFVARPLAGHRLRSGLPALLFLVLLLISGTRSAIVGLVGGHVVLAFMTWRGAVASAGLFLGMAMLLLFAPAEYMMLFRAPELLLAWEALLGGFERLAYGGSISYRMVELWPAILSTMTPWRLLFGWGHLGVTYLPESSFTGLSHFTLAGLSAESQVMDVIQRQGLVSLALFVAIAVTGFVYAGRLARRGQPELRAIFLAAIAWQLAIQLHGVTVETLRFAPYSLFHWLFLGALSQHWAMSHRSQTAAARRDGAASAYED